MTAADKIWAFHDGPMVGLFVGREERGTNVAEYIRADLHQAAIDAAVLAERERCAAHAGASDHLWPDDAKLLADEIRKGEAT